MMYIGIYSFTIASTGICLPLYTVVLPGEIDSVTYLMGDSLRLMIARALLGGVSCEPGVYSVRCCVDRRKLGLTYVTEPGALEETSFTIVESFGYSECIISRTPKGV